MAQKKHRTGTAEQKAIDIARRFSVWLRNGGDLNLSSDQRSQSGMATPRKKRPKRAA
jgi:hypothetical protein